MKQYYLHKSGGLGDCIWAYFKLYHHLLTELKKNEPNSHVTYVACSNNTQIQEFYKTNKLIDQAFYYPMSDYHHQTWVKHTENKISLLDAIQVPEQPPANQFWLTPEEQQFAQNVLNMGKFVALHPFGGTHERTMNRNDFSINQLITSIINLNYNCIVLGGNDDQRKCNLQKINFNHPKCINIIDKFSCRLHSFFAAHANAFVGVSSCYSVIASLFKVKGLIYYPISLKWWQQGTPPQIGIDGFSQAFRDSGFWAEFFEQPSTTTTQLITNFLNT